MTPTETDRRADHRLRGRPAQDPRPDGDQRRRVVHRWGADRRRRPRCGRRGAVLPDRRGLAGPHDLRRPRRPPAPPPRGRARHPGTARPAASRACRIPGSPASGRTARRTCSRRGSPGRSPCSPSVDPTGSRLATSTSASLAIERRSHRPAADRAVPRDELRIRRARTADAARRGRGRSVHRPPVRRLGDERRRAQPRGPPGPDDRHPAGRRRRQHRRGRRGSGLVRAGAGRRAPRRADQAGRLRAVRGHRRLSRPRGPARDQDRPGLEARRGRPAARAARRRPTSRRSVAASPARATSARRRITTSTRSRTWPSSIADLRAINPRGPDRGQARRRPRGRDDRRGRRQGRRLLHPPVRPRRRDRCVAALVDQARRRAVGARVLPRSTRSCCATTCATGSRSGPTAACRPGATCSSPPSSAPRSSRSGPRHSWRSAATWPASAISTPVRPGIATQREDLRAKFAGTPDDVVRYFTAIAEDFRRELAAVGARSVGEIVGESRRLLRAIPQARAELAPVIGAAPWPAGAARRADPTGAGREIGRASRVVARGRHRGRLPRPGLGHGRRACASRPRTARSGPG